MIGRCVLLFCFIYLFLPVFDYPLYDGICGEAVPAVHGPQDPSPPRLLHINKTAPGENGSDYSHESGWWWLGKWGGSYSIRVGSVPARVDFCPPVTYKIHLQIKNKNLSAGFIVTLSLL